MPRRVWLTVLLVLGCVVPYAPGQVRLTWKLAEGDTFFVETVSSRKGVVTLKGEKREQSAVKTSLMRFKVLEKGPKGFVLEEQIIAMRVKMTGGALGDPLVKVSRGLKGVKFKLTVGLHGEISRFEGYDAAMKKIAANNPAILKMLRSLVPEEAFKEAARDIFIPLPQKAVAKGTSWKTRARVPLGPLGFFEADKKFVYRGPAKDKKGDRIKVEAALKYEPARAKEEGLPFKISGGTIKATKAEGTILFNAAAGRLVSSELKLHYKGALTIEAGENKATLKVEQDETVTIRVLEKNPLP
jgi:hypothetical protein